MQLPTWAWDPEKDRSNRQKHKLSFQTAVKAFDDPAHVTFDDPCEWEERWRTLGQIQGVLIIVVHTDPIMEATRVLQSGRLISARKATPKERAIYEDYAYGR